jgi:3-oxoacyl-[acyl-carrier-protein] synthase-3
LEAAREALGLRAEQVVVTVAEHANTSGASIPLALDNARARFKTGDVLLLQAFGAGFVWGSALIRW